MNLQTWQSNVQSLTRNLYTRHPHLEASLSVLHHPPDRPCSPACPSCGNRHRTQGPTSACPCRVCHQRHKGECPAFRPGEAGRPGCLVCLNVDDAERANAVADLGDGVRSPTLEPGSRSLGTHSTPTERAAETIDHGDALALADASRERDVVLDALSKAHHTHDPAHAADMVRDATNHARRALSALDRFSPSHRAPEPSEGADPGCQSCRRARNHRGVPLFSETEQQHADAPAHRPLCQWCRKWSDAYKAEWVNEHPHQPPPSLPQRFWPPLSAVEWRRDNEGKNATPSLWVEWRAAKRAEKKRKKAS